MAKDLSFEIKIDISTEKIVGKLSLDNTSISLNNIAVINRKEKYVVAVGKNLIEYKSHFSEAQEVSDADFDTVPIFDIINFSPEISARVTLGLINNLLKQSKLGLNRKLTIFINFLNYEKVELPLKNEFEFMVVKFGRAKNLIINRQESQANYVKLIFLQLTYIGSSLFGIFFIILSYSITEFLFKYLGISELLNLLDLLICAFAIFVPLIFFLACGLFMAEFLWMFFMRFFFPKQMIRNTILYFYSPSKLKINPISLISHKLLLIEKS